MVVAGILAFLTNLALVRSGDATVAVAVAATDLVPGTSFDPAAHVRLVPLAADSELAGALVSGAHLPDLAGSVVARPVGAGEPLVRDALVAPSAPLSARAMSIPVSRETAAGGAIVAGDRVDVIVADDGAARYVLANAEVLAVPDPAGGRFHLVVAVDAEEALAVAAALDEGTVHVVRSTGAAEPPDTAGGE